MNTVILCMVLVMICAPIVEASNDAKIIYQTIAYESSDQEFDAQVAVARVIRTRMKERKQTALQVCLAHKQFDCWDINGKPKQTRILTEQELKTAEQAWEISKTTPSSFAPNLYHDTSIDPPYWAYSPKVIKLCQIGNLIFYKEITA